MHRTLAAAAALVVLSLTPAHAGPAESIPASEDFLDQFLNSDSIPVPTKKAPFFYGVEPYAADGCDAFSKKPVDKITGKKAWSQLSLCISNAIANEETPETTWKPSDIESLLIGFDNPKQEKAIRKALKKYEIIEMEVYGSEDAGALHVYFAVDSKGTVRGLYMRLDAAG